MDLRPVVSRIAVPGAGSPSRNSPRTTGLTTYFAVPLASLRFVSRRLGTGFSLTPRIGRFGREALAHKRPVGRLSRVRVRLLVRRVRANAKHQIAIMTRSRSVASSQGAPSRPPARPRGTRRWRQPTLRPYAVRHEGDRPGVAALRSTAARHPHGRLEGVSRGEPASEAVLAWRRDVGHVSAERATGTSRGHPHADVSRAVPRASKLSTPFEEPDPVQTRSQDLHPESKLARSVIPACVLAP